MLYFLPASPRWMLAQKTPASKLFVGKTYVDNENWNIFVIKYIHCGPHYTHFG